MATATAIIAIILLVAVAFQAFQTYSLSKKADAIAAKTAELNRLPSIQVTTIAADCAECAGAAAILKSVEAARANITKKTELSASDAESLQLIQKYGIKRLPTAIVTGETGKLSVSGFSKSGDALLYSETPAPYYDVAEGRVKGLVKMTYVNDSACMECANIMPVAEQIRSQVKVVEFKVLDYRKSEGAKAVTDYQMARLPGILISSEVSEYPIGAQIASAGTLKKDGVIALGASAPYLNVSTGKVAGITQLTLLNDSTCGECYNPHMHVQILKGRFGVYSESIRVLDAASAEGKALIAKYAIKAVPTIVVTGDVSAYEAVQAIWPSVGTVEKDGAYIFREMGKIAGSPYKDLTTGKVELNAAQQ